MCLPAAGPIQFWSGPPQPKLFSALHSLAHSNGYRDGPDTVLFHEGLKAEHIYGLEQLQTSLHQEESEAIGEGGLN